MMTEMPAAAHHRGLAAKVMSERGSGALTASGIPRRRHGRTRSRS